MKTLNASSKQKIYPIKKIIKKKKKKKPKIYVFGRIGRIPYDPTILYDPTYNLTIFTILVQS